MIKFFSTGSENLNELLDGGLVPGEITHFYGESGGGKTTVGLQSAIECAKEGYFCIYISSDRFSFERFKQLGGTENDLASNFLIFNAKTFSEQSKAVRKIPEKIIEEEKEVGLVVLDSLTFFYNPRSVEEGKRIELKQELFNQMIFLLGYARRYNFSLVIINQVYEDIDTGELHPREQRLVMDISSKSIELKRTKERKRLAILRKTNLEAIDSVPLKVYKAGIK